MSTFSKKTILVVEDDPSLRQLLIQNLEYEGYHILAAENGQKGLLLAESEAIDLILLDLMLPKMSGIALCKHIRAKGNTVPIIMLTAKDLVGDKVKGLKQGADDYVSKPFDLLELLARIEAVLRRKKDTIRYEGSYTLGELRFDFTQQKIFQGNRVHDLTQQENLLLRYLVHHEGEILSREQIFQDIWGHDHLYSMRTIDTHITKLRQKIELIPAKPKHILTVHRVGYKFMGA